MRLYSKLAVWQIFMTCFFIDSFESRTDESKVPDRIRDGDVVRTKSNRVREGTVEGFKEDEKGKRRAVLSSFSLS